MPEERDFKYRFGLSFPGQINPQPAGVGSFLQRLPGFKPPAINFRQTVEEVADRMKASCQNNKELVLFDLYHDAYMARPNLDEFLPKQYRCCELVVVFLCKDYADKRWCQSEWRVIQALVKDPDQRERVMYLWHGERDDRVSRNLGLDWARDGFLPIDGLSAESIWQKVDERYKRDCKEREKRQRDRPVSGDPLIARVPVDEACPIDHCWRLLVIVERPFAWNPQATAEPFYGASPLLIHADGRHYKDPSWPESATGQPLTLKALARSIVCWFDQASLWVEDRSDGAEAQVIVVLALPVALLTSRRVHACLGLVRQRCRADADGVERQPPPIVLACEEIQQATLTSCQATLTPAADWLSADRAARNISRAIISRCAAPSGQLQALNWWMYHDAHDQAEPGPQHGPDCGPRPRHFAGDGVMGRVHPARDLENRSKPLRVAESGNGDDKPHALLLSWRPDLPPEPFGTRVRRILKAGVPLFLMDSPGLLSQLDQQQPELDGTEHPFDGLLRCSHGELIHTVCKHHRMLDRPAQAHGAREWDYVRHSLLYWDDHRCRRPLGAAPAPGGTVGSRSDGFVCVFQ